MSLTTSLAKAFLAAAEQDGVDPLTYLTAALGKQTAPEELKPEEAKTKRPYNRVVPEGDLKELAVGTYSRDSRGRLHHVVELPAFNGYTRKAWKLANVQEPVQRSDSLEPHDMEDASSIADLMPTIKVDSVAVGKAETVDAETKQRRSYTRVVPNVPLSDAEEGEIQEDALGRPHVATRVRVRGGGHRLTWKFLRNDDGEKVQPEATVSFAEPVETAIPEVAVSFAEPVQGITEGPAQRVRKAYTSMKPPTKPKTLPVDSEEEGKDGQTWVIKAFTGPKGTRHAWVRKPIAPKQINIDASKGITPEILAQLVQQLGVV